MRAIHAPETDIPQTGGWETDYVIKGAFQCAVESKDKAAR